MIFFLKYLVDFVVIISYFLRFFNVVVVLLFVF